MIIILLLCGLLELPDHVCPGAFRVEGVRPDGSYTCSLVKEHPEDLARDLEHPRVVWRMELPRRMECAAGRVAVARMDARGVRCVVVEVDAQGIAWVRS